MKETRANTEFMMASHDYNAEYEDELSFLQGDIIEIMSKSTEDEGWLKGRIKGEMLNPIRFSIHCVIYEQLMLICDFKSI